MSRTLLPILLVLVVMFNLYCSQCSADVMVTYSLMTVTSPGEYGVDVYLSSNSNDAMNSFAAEFLITSTNNPGGLKFITPQRSSQLDDPNYVMSSYGFVYGTLLESRVMTTFTHNDTYRGSDMALVLRFPTVIPNTNKLFFHLDLDASGVKDGDIFNVRLLDKDDTGFGSPLFYNPIIVDPRSYSNSGTLVVGVPEPNSLLMSIFITSLLFITILIRRRKRYVTQS